MAGPQPFWNPLPSNFLPVANSPSSTSIKYHQHDYPPPVPQFGVPRMQHARPDWAGNPNIAPQAPQGMPQIQTINVDVHAFVRTRDALTGAYANLSNAINNTLNAYIEHTRIVLAGDATLDISYLTQPIGLLQPQQMMAQMALNQNGGAPIAPMLQNGQSEFKVDDEGDGKKKRKKRAYKPRDPNAPKRPLTAYFRYLGQMRPIIQAEMNQNPEQFEEPGKPGEISRIATERWNLLSVPEQQPYKAAYQAELKDYEIAITAYKAAGGLLDETAADNSTAAVAGAVEPVIAAPVVAAKADSDTSSDSSDSDDEAPPPPPAATPKKSATKKGGRGSTAAVPIPQSSTVNDAAAEQLQTESAKSSSPSKKRKSAGDATEPEGGKKKRGRKAKADEAVAEPEPASSPPAESSGKKKKDRKKKKAGD